MAGNLTGEDESAFFALQLAAGLCPVKLPDGGVERVYGATPVCKYLTNNEEGFSFAPLCLMNHDMVFMESCNIVDVEHVGGDMFIGVPQGDAIFMKWILHDWSDEHCLKVLKNCYEAILADGKVILTKCILPEQPDTCLPSKLIVGTDLLMLAYNPGGKERTKKEFESLAKAAGFNGIGVHCSAYCTTVMELLKNKA